MGGVNIPLPALAAYRPEPQPDPLEQYARLVQLRSMAQSQQLQQGQLQLQQQQIQQNQRKMQEGEAVRQSFVANNGDIDKTIADVSRNRTVSPETLQALQLHSVDLKTKNATASDAALKLR